MTRVAGASQQKKKTPRDDVEGVGGATGSVRIVLMTMDDTRIVCGVPVALDART